MNFGKGKSGYENPDYANFSGRKEGHCQRDQGSPTGEAGPKEGENRSERWNHAFRHF
jgi:hypothetical protein